MLNDNQIKFRVNKIIGVLFDLSVEDRRTVYTEAAKMSGLVGFQFVEEGDADPDEIPKSFTEKIRKSINGGLDRNDPNMTRVALDYESEQSGRDYLTNLTINITPYVIKDSSLAKIALEADDETVKEIEAALVQRKRKK